MLQAESQKRVNQIHSELGIGAWLSAVPPRTSPVQLIGGRERHGGLICPIPPSHGQARSAPRAPSSSWHNPAQPNWTDPYRHHYALDPKCSQKSLVCVDSDWIVHSVAERDVSGRWVTGVCSGKEYPVPGSSLLSLLVGGHGLSRCPPPTPFHHAISASQPADHRRKPWAKTNLSSIRLWMYFVSSNGKVTKTSIMPDMYEISSYFCAPLRLYLVFLLCSIVMIKGYWYMMAIPIIYISI